MRDSDDRRRERDRDARGATAIPRHKYPRWGRIGIVAAAAAVGAWAIGREASRQIEIRDIAMASRHQPPAEGFPQESLTADHNNLIMRMGLVGDLDGKAIAYDAIADRLLLNGQFRIDLPLDDMSELLHISRDLLANPKSPNDVDPDAELFRAQAGTLTEGAKDLSRKLRARQVLEGKKPDAVVAQWSITNFSFTLRRLEHPNDEEKSVLSAIILAAAETMPRPGDKIRAVVVSAEAIAGDRIALWPGMLPVQRP